jgi:hypothetical protein
MRQISKRLPPLIVPSCIYCIGALIFFRGQLFSHFDQVFGDRFDARLIAFLHEHVYRSLTDASSLLSPPFFFNQADTLGYSDALLLNQALYAPLRYIGVEPLLALSLSAIVLSATSYSFMFLFMRRIGVTTLIASGSAFIVTFANNLFVSVASSHTQQLASYYIPIIVFSGLLAVTNINRHPKRAYFCGAIAGGIYGLLFSTGYYMAWFFGLALCIFIPSAVYTAWPEVRGWWSRHPMRALALAVLVGLSFLATLLVFIAIYGPVLATGVTRIFDEYLLYAPEIVDVVNVGTQNIVWGSLLKWLHLVGDRPTAETSLALTPVLQVLLILSSCLSLYPRFWSTSGSDRLYRAFTIASAAVCFLFFALIIKVQEFSLFKYLYAMVPGANAIRAGYRGMVVANFFAAAAVGVTLDHIIRLLGREPRTKLRIGGTIGLTGLVFLAAIEQVNLTRATNLSRKFERERLASLGAAPRECRAFFVAGGPARHPASEAQIDAMMISLSQHVPTINGYSGRTPAGWDLDDITAPRYEKRAISWAAKRGIADGLCRFDLGTQIWRVVALDHNWKCASGGCVRAILFDEQQEFQIDLTQSGNGEFFTDDHWAEPEGWGQWTSASQAALSFSIGNPRELGVRMFVRALLSASAPKERFWIEANQCRIGGAEFDLAHTPGRQAVSGIIPASCTGHNGKVILRLHTDRVRSPREIGVNADTRTLGVGIERVIIRDLSTGAR